MKYLLPLCFVMLSLLAVTSCKKADDIDPDSFIGVYECQSTLSYGYNSQITTERPQTFKLTISKSNGGNSKSLIFLENYPAIERRYSVYLSGATFVLDKTTEQIIVSSENKKYTGVLSGSGTFANDGKMINYTTSTDAVTAYGAFTRSFTVEGKKQ